MLRRAQHGALLSDHGRQAWWAGSNAHPRYTNSGSACPPLAGGIAPPPLLKSNFPVTPPGLNCLTGKLSNL